MNKILFSFCFCLGFTTVLYSEIQNITLRWTNTSCQETCSRLLEKEFRKIQGMDQISIDTGSKQADLTWKENIPFQYTSLNTALHMVGLSPRDVRIRVRGRVKHNGNAFFIISEGDNTRFELMNPVVPNPGGVAPQFNAYARQIKQPLKQKLLDGEAQQEIATIEGPIFMPERMTVPTQIVVDQLDFVPVEAPPAHK